MFILLNAFCITIFSQNTTARFLLSTPSARSMAMGGTGVAFWDNAFALYYNPAAAAFMRPLNLTASYVEPFPFEPDQEYSAFSGVLLNGELGALALSFNIYALGYTPWTGESGPEILGIDKAKAWVYRITYSYPVTRNFSIGTTLNYFVYDLTKIEYTLGYERGSARSRSVFMNIGLLRKNLFPGLTFRPDDIPVGYSLRSMTDYVPRNGFSAGLAILNLGPKIAFVDNKQADNLPAILLFGLNYSIVDSRAVGVEFAVDLEKQIYESSVLDYVHLGGDYNFLQLFSIRAGLVLDTYGAKNSYLTTGFGIHTRILQVDLARYAKGPQDAWHYNVSFLREF
jgi:hypothetical protein